MARIRTHVRRALAVLLALTSSGCAYALSPPGRPDPRFDRAVLATLERNLSPLDLRARFGEPASERTAGEYVVWQYEDVTSVRQCRAVLFGVLPLSARRHDVRHLELRFKDSRLDSATLTERLADRAYQVDLLPPRE